MGHFKPRDPDFERRAGEGFARQTAMKTIGAVIENVAPGTIEIGLPFSDQFVQQNGYMHAGILTAAVDTACGFAAMTLTEAGSDILTVEYKVNFVAPAKGSRFRCSGQVLKAGKTLTICEGKIIAEDGSLVAAMLTTMMVMRPQQPS